MGQELKIRHCVLKIKVNTNLFVRTGPNKAYIILQLKFYHHSGSSNSESQFQDLTLQVQVQVQVQVLGLRVQVQFKSSRNRTRVRLESKSRTRVLQLCKQGCVLAPVIFRNDSLQMLESPSISGYMVIGNLFSIRRLQAKTKFSSDTIFDRQYADDAATPNHTAAGLQCSLDLLAATYHRACQHQDNGSSIPVFELCYKSHLLNPRRSAQ